jgi:hypothetical protein
MTDADSVRLQVLNRTARPDRDRSTRHSLPDQPGIVDKACATSPMSWLKHGRGPPARSSLMRILR